MESFLTRYKNILVLVSVLVAQIIGLAVQIRRPNASGQDASSVRLIRSWAVGLIAPPEKGLRGVGGGIRGAWSGYLDLRHVRQQNNDLRAKVARLQLEQAALLEDARQGQRLQQLLAFREHYIYTTVPAQVIGTAGTDQSRILYIDKGSKDGLKPDMAVITPDGIVGKLKDVFSHTAQVLEISDQTSGAGVLLESTRLRGVLRGNALGQPQIINLLPDERVKPGEKVVTSGGDQIFPRGIPVGVVDHVVDDAQNPPYVDIVIKPAANLGRLEEVLVITQTGSQMPPKEQQDLAESTAAAGAERASDILAQRLPGLDPPKPVDGKLPPNQVPAAPADGIPPPVKAPEPLHADRYTPDDTPPAADLIPGKRFAPPLPTPISGGKAQTGRRAPASPASPARPAKPAPSAAAPRHGAPVAGSHRTPLAGRAEEPPQQ